jgi:hypothetical protein
VMRKLVLQLTEQGADMPADNDRNMACCHCDWAV